MEYEEISQNVESSAWTGHVPNVDLGAPVHSGDTRAQWRASSEAAAKIAVAALVPGIGSIITEFWNWGSNVHTLKQQARRDELLVKVLEKLGGDPQRLRGYIDGSDTGYDFTTAIFQANGRVSDQERRDKLAEILVRGINGELAYDLGEAFADLYSRLSDTEIYFLFRLARQIRHGVETDYGDGAAFGRATDENELSLKRSQRAVTLLGVSAGPALVALNSLVSRGLFTDIGGKPLFRFGLSPYGKAFCEFIDPELTPIQAPPAEVVWQRSREDLQP